MPKKQDASPLTEEDWKDVEQMLGVARMMNGSWEETYVQIDAFTLMRIMRQAGWKPSQC